MFVFFLVGASVVIALLLLLRRIRPASARFVIACLAGFFTAYAIWWLGFTFKGILPVDASMSWRLVDAFEWSYEQLFGVATFVARLFSPDYIAGSDLILPEDEAGALVAGWLPIVIWSSLFAAIYFLRVRPRTI